jgi:hypothetical protein
MTDLVTDTRVSCQYAVSCVLVPIGKRSRKKEIGHHLEFLYATSRLEAIGAAVIRAKEAVGSGYAVGSVMVRKVKP